MKPYTRSYRDGKFSDLEDSTLDRPVRVRQCDHPGCGLAGDYRAPKSRDHLQDYYWFCMDHVRDYNRNWDYYAGYSPSQIEKALRDASIWDRPTWPMGQWRVAEQNLRDSVDREFFGAGADEQQTSPPAAPLGVGVEAALLVLDLKMPVVFSEIKTRYRHLVKQYHPDLHGGNLEAEEKFKAINQAFTFLKGYFVEEQAA